MNRHSGCVLFGTAKRLESVVVLNDTRLLKREDFKVRILVGSVVNYDREEVLFRNKKAVSNIRVFGVLNFY